MRQIAPKVAYRADTLYYRNLDGMEKKTKELETQQLAVAQAETAAKEVATEAAKAKEEAKRLRKVKRPF